VQVLELPGHTTEEGAAGTAVVDARGALGGADLHRPRCVQRCLDGLESVNTTLTTRTTAGGGGSQQGGQEGGSEA
jgi:hypothetical protein